MKRLPTIALLSAALACGQATRSRGTAGATVVAVSSLPGVVMDADPSGPGTQTCTGNSVAIAAGVRALRATFSSVVIQVDGYGCLDAPSPNTYTCIDLSGLSNVTFQGSGPSTGFMVKAGAYCGAFQNGAYPSAGASPPQSNGNLQFIGFRIDGNYANNTNPHCSSAANCFGIAIWNTQNVLVDRMYIINVPSFATVFANCKGVRVLNSDILQRQQHGTDAIHFDGGVTEFFIHGNRLSTLDGCVDFNTPEGYGAIIAHGLVSDNQAVGGGCGAFVAAYNCLSSGVTTCYSFHDIQIHNFEGIVACKTTCAPLELNEGNGRTAAPDLNSIVATHIYWTGGAKAAYIVGNYSDLILDDWRWRSPAPQTVGAMVDMTSGSATQIDNVRLTNFGVVRNDAGNAAVYPLALMYNTAWIGRLVIGNIFALDEQGSGSYAPMPQVVALTCGSGSTCPAIGSLVIESPLNDNGKIRALVNAGGFAYIANVLGQLPGTYTVSQLPKCTPAMDGQTYATVTNSPASPAYLSPLSGTGSTHVTAKCLNKAWVAD